MGVWGKHAGAKICKRNLFWFALGVNLQMGRGDYSTQLRINSGLQILLKIGSWHRLKSWDPTKWDHKAAIWQMSLECPDKGDRNFQMSKMVGG